MAFAYDYSRPERRSHAAPYYTLELKPLRMRAFTTDTSSAASPGDVSLVVWHSVNVRQTSNLLDWQDDDIVRCALPDLGASIRETTINVNVQAARENLYEVRRLTSFTWDELASLLEVDRRSLHNWAQGGPVRSANQARLAGLLAALLYIDRGSAEANRLALGEPDATGATSLVLLGQGRFDEVRRRVGQGRGRLTVSGAMAEGTASLRTRALGLGYFSEGAEDEEGGAPPARGPVASRRIPLKRG